MIYCIESLGKAAKLTTKKTLNPKKQEEKISSKETAQEATK